MSAKTAGKSKKVKNSEPKVEETVDQVVENSVADEVQLSDTDDKLLQLSEENERLRDQMLRARAEFENYKKRRSNDIEQLAMYANEGLIEDLLPVLDDLDLMITHARESNPGSPLLDGAEKIQQKLNSILERRGLVRIDAMGATFNPDEHEALMQQPSANAEPGTVIAVHQQGYRLGEKLLRPSRVVIASEAAGEAQGG